MRILQVVKYYCVLILQVHLLLHSCVKVCYTLPFKYQHILYQSEVKILLAQLCVHFFICIIFSKAFIAGDLKGSDQ
jgi:hypothetical protein